MGVYSKVIWPTGLHFPSFVLMAVYIKTIDPEFCRQNEFAFAPELFNQVGG